MYFTIIPSKYVTENPTCNYPSYINKSVNNDLIYINSNVKQLQEDVNSSE